MIITFFSDHAAQSKREVVTSLDELAALVKETSAPEKRFLPLLKPAKFGDMRTSHGSLRHNQNVVALTGVAVDYDGEMVQIDNAAEELDKAGIHALVYTSPSYRPEAPRWRVVCPFSGELPPLEHEHMVNRLNGLLSGVLASESWVLSQSYYYGSVNSNPAHRVEIIRGTAMLDRADGLDLTAIGKSNDPGNGAVHRAGGEPQADVGNILAALTLIPNVDRDWEDWNRIGMAIWRASVGSDEGLTAFLDWSRKSAKFDQEETEYRWRHFQQSPPSEIGFGTLVHLARQAEPDWVPPSRRAGAGTPIRLIAGQRPAAVAAGMAALVGGGDVYRRDKTLVYVARVPARSAEGRTLLIPGIAKIETPHLGNLLGRAASWTKYDGRSRAWKQVDVPGEIATTIAALPNDWPFPTITGVISTPTMRPDGTLLHQEGYDATTGYFLFDPPPMPSLPATPSREDAQVGLQLLLDLLSEFPFADAASRSVALSLILSMVLRPALAPAVPLHVITAPEAGSGKSYLFDIASLIAIGEVAPAIGRGLKPEETEKRLVGAALEGRTLILLDNVNGMLQSEFLCQAVERPLIKPRPLGTSVMPTIANSFVCGANGINIEIADDLVRRTLRGSLDANLEQPYLRAFRRDPTTEILADRGKFVAAALTIVRAYVCAGMPERPTRLASFGRWSDKVRGALIWLGQDDPVNTIAKLSVADPMRERRGEVLATIAAAFPSGDFSVRDLVQKAAVWDPLNAVLEVVARGKDGYGGISNESLGWWLRRNADRIAGGYKLIQGERVDGGKARWVVAPVTPG